VGNDNERDPLLDVYLFEATQLIDQLEEIMLETDKSGVLTKEHVNEIFRCMHTIKGSSAMMMYDNISKLAHSVEDLFYFIREKQPEGLDISTICDLVLSASDFIKQEVAKISDGKAPDGVGASIEEQIKKHLELISGAEKAAEKPANAPAATKPEAVQSKAPSSDAGSRYIVRVYFDEGGQMENLRAYTIVRNMAAYASELYTYPADVISASAELILREGFSLFFKSEEEQAKLSSIFNEALYLKSYEISKVDSYEAELQEHQILSAPVQANAGQAMEKSQGVNATIQKAAETLKAADQIEKEQQKGTKLSLISVNVNKLDMLMNLVGEIVISESMVTKNPDLNGLELENFNKSSRQLRKLTDELQDIVMSIRMVQIAGTFQKMQRIVRDMSRSLNKDVEFVTEGESTEVDKNIIDHLSDPLMHLIRNAMDHGVEDEQDRIKAGKSPRARVTLSAQNVGGDVLISVSDDGKGLDKEKILKKATEKGLLKKPAKDMTDKEIFSLIMLPGFSTTDKVTEFSGRGVGMDVVKQNIGEIGGNVSIKSVKGQGMTVTIIIPLTLAVADAMELSVGNCIFTLPTTTIRESFRPKENEIIHDNMGNEMIMIRGNVYAIIRLHKLFKIETNITKLSEGILIMAEGENKTACIFADCLLGEQQIVVKPLPQYLVGYNVKDFGVEGCTILGNGCVSLILNSRNLINKFI
jgi:two-component system chemotaxis sensor kinase CheA